MQATLETKLDANNSFETEAHHTENDPSFKLLNEAVFWLFIIWPLASLAIAIYFLLTGH